MELLSRTVIVGVFAPAPPGQLDQQKVNNLWNEISVRHEYRQYAYEGVGAHFSGRGPDDGLVLQPPIVQVRSSARLGVANAADEAEEIIAAAGRHLGWPQFLNLGVKIVFHAPAPASGAREYVRHRLLGDDARDLDELDRGGGVWVGLKLGMPAADGSQFTLVVEPLHADDAMLFVDLDAQFPGPCEPGRIRERAAAVEDYAQRAVKHYLENAE